MGPSRRASARRRPGSGRGKRVRLRKVGWRWRRNALRRRTDVVEACLGVVTTVLFCLSPLVGWWAGQSVDRTLQGVVRSQRASRTLVTATIVPAAADRGAGADQAVDDGRKGDILRWTAPDGTPRTKKVAADVEVWRTGKVQVWTDRGGDLVPAPLDGPTAATHAVLAGIAVGAATCGVVLIGRALVMWRLMRRRLDLWEREWARVGQDWGRAGAGG